MILVVRGGSEVRSKLALFLANGPSSSFGVVSGRPEEIVSEKTVAGVGERGAGVILTDICPS